MPEVKFQAEFSKIGTGKPLAKESAGALTAHISFEFNAMSTELDELKKLNAMGLLEITCRPVNPDLFDKKPGDAS